MSIPTVAVTCTAYDQNGNAVAGGTFRARLNSTEIYNGFVVPEQVVGVADASGVCVLQLWPNALGVAGSAYRITAVNPDTGQKYLDTTAVVPNSACNLHQIIVAAPYPTVDASQQALVAAQAALAPVTAQAAAAAASATNAATSATASATSATAAAGSASTATTQAGIATTQAGTATTQAGIATTQAGTAATQASTATTQAGVATTQAGIATTKASEAVASASTATTQAGVATTQAGIATTKASEAATSAANANNSAFAAGLSVDATTAAKNQAISSASAAASSATSAAGSATAAATSASSASSSASTATTQAGTATTQAGLATTAASTATTKASEASTFASNASASAATATTQAGVATTQAGVATTQAGVATTQAGIAITNANAALSVYGSVAAQQASVTAAQNAATSATASAAAANTSAGNASGSAASALAIYGTAAAQQAALSNAQAAASVAQGYAASAASVAQQDLSGVTSAALHRSPNAVTAMFLYDTSKDSDGGAWTEKCQHTSWYNEAVTGKWLGAQDSEFNARYEGATLSADVVNGGFDTDTVWTKGANWTISDGAARMVTGSSSEISQVSPVTLSVGDVVKVTFTITARTTGFVYILVAGNLTNNNLTGFNTAGTYTRYVTISSVTNQTVGFNASNGPSGIAIDNVSFRKVTALNTSSNDYFQLTTDGKFYRLWKNILKQSNNFTDAYWGRINVTPTAVATVIDGVTATQLTKLADGNAWLSGTVTTLASGTPFCISVVAKAGTASVLTIHENQQYNGIGSFDLSAGTATKLTGFANAGVSIQPLGNGEYRCIAYGVSNGLIMPFFHGGSGNFGGTWATGTSVLIAKAQIEYGSVATAYEAKTTDGATTEVFRGNKRKFPKLAGIVAEAGNVNIYDLTEPGRPMWMRFANGGFIGWVTSTSISGVAALNGCVVPVATTGTGGLLLNFPKDDVGLIWNSSYVLRKRLIALRNAANSFSAEPGGFAVAATGINAVAMTVLPDAPVDPVTGLKVPTIAVATAGVSVIRHDGLVVTAGSGGQTAIKIFGRRFYCTGITPNAFAGVWYFELNLNGAVTNSTSYNFYGPVKWQEGSGYAATQNAMFVSNKIKGVYGDQRSVGLLCDAPTSTSKGSVAYVRNTFNTGHLVGDIRRAYLADVDTGSVSGAELVVNGGFDTDTSGWGIGQGATLSVDANRLLITNGNFGFAVQGITVVSGKTYILTGTYTAGTATTGRIVSYMGNQNGSATQKDVGTGPFSMVFVGQGVSCPIGLQLLSGTAGQTGYFDNISVKECSADRSYKAQAASITGTLTKSQVASAAQLVAYSGFSASNYLREPAYSADLDFGTGEWSVGAWVNVPLNLATASWSSLGGELNTFTVFQGWTPQGTGVSIDAGTGVLTLINPSSTTPVYRSLLATVGKTYTVTVTIDSISGGGILFRHSGGAVDASSVFTTPGTYTFTFTRTGGDAGLGLRSTSTSLNAVVSAISVKEVAGTLTIADRAHSSGASIKVGVVNGGFLTATAFDGTTTRTVTTTAAYNTATWLKARANYTTDGSLAITVNGVEVAVTRGNPLLTLNNSNAVLTIGNSYALDAPFPGSIALLKASATVPTAEQMVWMYEQEKQMFRDGAQVTLPDSGSIVDLTYDDLTDKWMAVSATNESEWSGLVRTSVTAAPAGSYSKITATSGVQLQARTTTNPGVDITIPAANLREELIKDGEQNKALQPTTAFDFVGGFTATTVNASTAITSVSGLVVPYSAVGCVVSGSGIPANTTVVAVSGTTIYLSVAATASASNVQIAFTDFTLPPGYTARAVSVAGAEKREGATADWTRRYDGFKETVRFGAAPAYNAWAQIQAVKEI